MRNPVAQLKRPGRTGDNDTESAGKSTADESPTTDDNLHDPTTTRKAPGTAGGQGHGGESPGTGTGSTGTGSTGTGSTGTGSTGTGSTGTGSTGGGGGGTTADLRDKVGGGATAG